MASGGTRNRSACSVMLGSPFVLDRMVTMMRNDDEDSFFLQLVTVIEILQSLTVEAICCWRMNVLFEN